MVEDTARTAPSAIAAPTTAAVASTRHLVSQTQSPSAFSAGMGFILFGTLACLLVAALHTLSLPILLTLTERHQFAEATAVRWATYVPLITAAVATPIIARMSDLHGRRQMIVLCLVLMLAGSVIGPLGMETRVELIAVLVGRGLQGISFAIVPVLMAATRELVRADTMVSALASFGAALGVGGIIGAHAGSLVFETFGWQWAFWICAIAATITLAIVPFCVPHTPRRQDGRFDLRGALLLSPATIGFLVLAIQGFTWGLFSAPSLALFLLSCAFLALWARTAARTASPMANVRSFRTPSVLLAHLCSFGIGWILLANTLITAMQVHATNVENSVEWSPGATALVILPQAAALLFVGPCAVVLSRQWGPKVLLVSGAVIALAGFVLRLYASPNGAFAVIWATIIGIGAALAATALPMLLNELAPERRIGALNGMNWLMRIVGTALALTMIIGLTTTYTVVAGGVSVPTWQSMWIVLLLSAAVCAGVLLCGTMIALGRTGRVRRSGERPPALPQASE